MDYRYLGRMGIAGLNGYRYSRYPWKNPQFLREIENKAIQKTVSIAYNQTDFYREKYKKHGVHPDDIRTIDDLFKLPIVTKKELKENFKAAIPKSLDKERAFLMGTSGTTGQPIQVYKDEIWLAHCFGFCIQMLRLHKMGIPKAAFILDVGSISSIETISRGYLKYFTKKSLVLSAEQDILETVLQLEKADVNYLLTYPGFMRELATLRKNGIGKRIKLKKIGVSGEILDNHTRNHIEEAFGCPCYSSYVCTETGPIAIECEKKRMHIYSDMMTVESVDDKGVSLPPGQDGNILLTCHDGGYGTPIIRYSGCADIGAVLTERCTCGLNTPVMGPIQGRSIDSIRLPDGRIYHAFAMTIPMEKIQREHACDRIHQYQIVQHELDSITISLVRNKEIARPDDTLHDLIEIIKGAYQQQLGNGIHLTVEEVDNIVNFKNRTTLPLVLSKIRNQESQHSSPNNPSNQ